MASTLVLRNRYLLLLALFSLVFTIVDTNGEYILSTLAEERAKAEAVAQHIPADQIAKFSEGFIATFYASFYLWVNLIGLTIQTFLVSRIVKLGGLKGAFFIYPAIALVSSVNNVVTPGLLGVDRLTAFRVTKTAENATDYSLNNTVRNMLWLPTTSEMKFKAKQAVDTFFVRSGDVVSAAMVFLCASRLQWPVQYFSIINIVLVALWIMLAIGIVRQHARLTKEQGEDAEREEEAGRRPAARVARSA